MVRKTKATRRRSRVARSSSSSSSSRSEMAASSRYVRRPLITSPPAIRQDFLQVRKIYRFMGQVTTNVIFNVTSNNLCSLMMLATAAASECSLFTSFKLHKISMWCASPGPTSNAEITINYVTSSASLVGGLGNERSQSDVSSGTTSPAYVSLAPPTDGVFGNRWFAPNATIGNVVVATVGCQLNGTVNSSMLIIDVDITHTILQNTTQLAQLIRAVAGATANTMYSASLDGAGVFNQTGEAVVVLAGL